MPPKQAVGIIKTGHRFAEIGQKVFSHTVKKIIPPSHTTTNWGSGRLLSVLYKALPGAFFKKAAEMGLRFKTQGKTYFLRT